MYSRRHFSLLLCLLLATLVTSCAQDDALSAESGRLELRNLTASANGVTPPGFFNDWLTMSTIATIPEDQPQWDNLAVQDTASLRLQNTSEDPLFVTSLTLSTPVFSLPGRPALPLEIAPNAFYDLTVRFAERSGEKGVRRGSLNVVSSGGTAEVQLAGVFMEVPEGNDEVTLQQITDAFGYTTNIGLDEDGRLSEVPGTPLVGDEVRAQFWERANSEAGVYIRQLAAYHGCCDEENFIEVRAQNGDLIGEFFHAERYAQSVSPLISGETGPAEMTLQPTSAFEIIVGAPGDSYSTNTEGNLGVRLWPVENRDGETVPNAYIIAEDYVQNGCGEGSANCDYQDNVYLITNVQPAQPLQP